MSKLAIVKKGVAERANNVRSMDSEALGRYVAESIAGVLRRLEDLRPYYEELWRRFDQLQDGETICGCVTRTEYCAKILHRSIRSVQFALYGRNTATKNPPSLAVFNPRPVIFPDAPIPQPGSDHTAQLTEIFSHFTGLNDVAKHVRQQKLDSPAQDEVRTLVKTLRKISADAGQRADLIEAALEKRKA